VVERYQIVIATDAQNKADAELLQPVHDEWIAKRPNGRAVYDRFVELVEEIRAETRNR